MSDAGGNGPLVILGGRSEIGLEVAVRLAPGREVILAARRSDELADEVARVEAAGAAKVSTVEFDADATDRHAALLDALERDYGPLDTVVLAYGVLGDQARAETDSAYAAAIVHTDYVAQVTMLTLLADRMRRRGEGRIVVFSSVAGIRVRRANYVYGSAKAGLDGFASGLADALHGTGVHLLIVQSGFVIGRMTEGMSPAPFSSTPDQVADAVVRGLRRKSPRVWVRGVLRPVFFGMRLLPQAVWRRLPR
ncbi:SDR family NAD(P)-dependent oxidoreductase [Aldersonia sp. NBC_00410]|uniref:SDR family NAD(P)-dependent oxidoreductase n=1 Tax=Aldersonia sp. NBC_00410 TaxID=2975954 RepID=UPI00225810A5|nr:SDR family NAD(P)-dependent oxidoreductase [Aldersonia sp. NBC_00410]MCX5045818.1 SDR family NAD(P)-dependent oxidoreductase [Aldersonia sp. NBC_00410]